MDLQENQDLINSERKEAIKMIEAYKKRLDGLIDKIDDEIKSRYFLLTCLGGDIECSGLYLYRKYHRKEWDDELKK